MRAQARTLASGCFNQEVIMQALSEKVAGREPAADTATRGADANKQALHSMLAAQRIIFEEMVFAAGAIFDRVGTETQLFNEFLSKLASSRSVHDWKAMNRDCSQHQLEFMRRDCDRLFRHGERLIETTSNFLNNRQ
jgi:hypothetical protein